MRMETDIPKQFLPVKGLPVLMRTINAFRQYDSNITVVLVLPREQQEFWKELCIRHGFAHPHIIADGGETRYHSVKNGLAKLSGEGLIAVHDGVRPLMRKEDIVCMYELAEEFPAVVPVMPVSDSMRLFEEEEGRSSIVDRSRYRLVQTPQIFWTEVLKQAYSAAYTPEFTDDASVVEKNGVPLHFCTGSRLNIKLTTPEDMALARAVVESGLLT